MAVAAIALGVGVVVWVTCCYESVRVSVTKAVLDWIGRSHIIVEPRAGVWGVFDAELEKQVAVVPGVLHTTVRTREYVEAAAGATEPARREGEPPGEPARREPRPPTGGPEGKADEDFRIIEVTGVVPQREGIFQTYKLTAGRFLEPGEDRAIVIEQLLARELKVGLGDTILLRRPVPPRAAQSFKIIGIVDRRRASVNQAMMTWARLEDVQALCNLPGKVKAVDAIVADPSVENIQRIAEDVQRIVDQHGAARKKAGLESEPVVVKTTEAQHKKLGAAQGLLQFIMMLLSCVVLLTAFFIVLATMSMGVTEQITQLGLLRCVGVTRGQLGRLVMLQTVPLGVIGTMLGVPLGVLLHWLTVEVSREYLGEMAISRVGVVMAVVGGIGTTLLGAVVPAASALFVSPVEAVRAHVGGRLRRWVLVLGVLGVLLIAGHEGVKRTMSYGGSGEGRAAILPEPRHSCRASIRDVKAAASESSPGAPGSPFYEEPRPSGRADDRHSGSRGSAGASPSQFNAQAVGALVLLYAGAAFLAPLVIVAVGRAVVWLAAAALGLRPQLLGDEVGKAPFRAAAISCGLMVALSLIVGLIVWGRSVKQGWEFPKEFPDALLYSYESLPLSDLQALRDTPGVKDFTVTDDFTFLLKKPPKSGLLRTLTVLDQFSRFLAVEPDEGLDLVKLTFIEGDEREARAKLKQGGYVLVSREFAQSYGKHVGDRVTIWVEKETDRYVKATFTVAGVVASPGVDIAISFFNATTYFQTYAVGTIVGTLDDARRLFGRSYGRLMLFNFDLPPETGTGEAYRIAGDSSQAVVPKTLRTPEGRQTFAAGPGPVPGDGPEERIVNAMLERLRYPPKAFVTARELKQQIDSSIDKVTLLLSAIPAVGLVIAALGVANLMAASVASRSRQTAVLRAIGVTRGQVARIVVGEALVLGLLGSVMGLALGVYLGRTSNFMTELLSGFRPEFAVPWTKVCLGAALATGLCLLAALIPARYASRGNIVAALSD